MATIDETVHVLFTNSGASGTIDELSGELETKLDGMSESDRLVTMRILQTFEGVLEAMELEDHLLILS